MKLYYSSEKSSEESGEWQHTRIELKPLNPEYESIVLESADEDAPVFERQATKPSHVSIQLKKFRQVRGEFMAVIAPPDSAAR